MSQAAEDFWVFAYGSLMWDPDFPHADAQPARLWGYHRALCLYSFDYRGTRQRPGLVLGLDRGGSCRGVAFLVRAGDREAVMAHLYKREASEGEYHLKWLKLDLGSKTVTGAAFVANHDNAYYAGKKPLPEACRLITQGHGTRGACIDYLINTVQHLRDMGIRDAGLERVLRQTKN